MSIDDTEEHPEEPVASQLNTNGKRMSDEDYGEQSPKRLANNHRILARQALQLPIEAAHQRNEQSESESDERVDKDVEQARDSTQIFSNNYMTRSYQQVNFPQEWLRRVWFHVAVAGNPNGHSYQMNLTEAIDPMSFSNGVQRRLELLGYEIGSGVMVADLFWIPTRSCLKENSDHDALMWQIWDWPGWRGEGEMTFLNIYLVLEDETAQEEA